METAELVASLNEHCQSVINGPVVAGRDCTRESHQALKASAEWAQLPVIYTRCLDGELFEARNCRCGSTLEVLINPTARAIADIVSRDSRPAVDFALPEGDVTALRDELEERYALASCVADCWDCDDLKRVKRLVVSASEDDAGTEAQELESAADEAESQYNEWVTFGRRAR